MSFIVGLEGKQSLGPESYAKNLVKFDGGDTRMNYGSYRRDRLIRVILGVWFI